METAAIRLPAALKREEFLSNLYGDFGKPGLQRLLSLLRLDLHFVRASGECLYYLRDGVETPVLDLLGGYGSTILGHNPASVRQALQRSLEEEAPVHAQLSVRASTALLARKLNEMIAGDSPEERPERYLVHLASTGTEAVEAALKHALMEWQDRRAALIHRLEQQGARPASLIESLLAAQPVILALEGAFHGKTAGALAATFNPSYAAMYGTKAIQSRFISRSATDSEVASAFRALDLPLADGVVFSRAIGFIAEPVQGEGGVHCLPEGLARALSCECRERGLPFIMDEIQSGLFRTGRLLASHEYGIAPDYVLLGKSLGGGMAKISALLVKESRYQADFGILHTSTFAEDEPSSRAAIAALEALESDSTIAARARAFEQRVRELGARLMRECPGVISDVRGRGFLMGLEFDVSLAGRAPIVMDLIAGTGLMTYCYASYLLHRHGIRVAPTLSQTNTIRLEPCAQISEPSMARLQEALADMTRKLHEGKLLDLTAHLWTASPDFSGSPVVSSFKAPFRRGADGPRRVTFLSHLIDHAHIRSFDPMLEGLSTDDIDRALDSLTPLSRSVIYHEQEIRGASGEPILLQLRGVFAASRYFERALRSKDSRQALEKVREGVRAAIESGSTHVGLGQYTSIVSNNGLLIEPRGAALTTGNSLTVGLAYQALMRLLSRRGQDLRGLRVGVVGAAGNIGNVYAQMLGDEAGGLTLIHREPIGTSPRFQAAVRAVLEHSRAAPEAIVATHELDALADCDVIVLGTNTAGQFLLPEHLKRDALVLDISVPSNVHPRVFSERLDVECFQGGYARLPLGQKLASPAVPAPNGEVFACMAETIAIGLQGRSGPYSIGALSKRGVLDSLVLAAEVGIELGSLKRMASF